MSARHITCCNCKQPITVHVHEWIIIRNDYNNSTARLPTCSQQCADDVYAKLKSPSIQRSVSVGAQPTQPEQQNDDPFE